MSSPNVRIIAVIAVALVAAGLAFIISTTDTRPPEVEQAQPAQQFTPVLNKIELPPATAGTLAAETQTADNDAPEPAPAKQKARRSSVSGTAVIAEDQTEEEEEPFNPKKYPTAEQSRQMQQKGIVLY